MGSEGQMDELKYLATWVREQHAREYIFTWLLNQPGIWWSNGDVYQAAIQKSGSRLKEYVKNSKQEGLFQGIADKIRSDEAWDAIALSLARLIATYQEELVKLQEQNRLDINKVSEISPKFNPEIDDIWSSSLQEPLPDPNSDALTGL